MGTLHLRQQCALRQRRGCTLLRSLWSSACLRAHYTCASSFRDSSVVVYNLLLRQWCCACCRVHDACVSGVRSTCDLWGAFLGHWCPPRRTCQWFMNTVIVIGCDYTDTSSGTTYGPFCRPSSEYLSSSLSAGRCHGTQRHTVMTNIDLHFAQPQHSEGIQHYALLYGSVTGAHLVYEFTMYSNSSYT